MTMVKGLSHLLLYLVIFWINALFACNAPLSSGVYAYDAHFNFASQAVVGESGLLYGHGSKFSLGSIPQKISLNKAVANEGYYFELLPGFVATKSVANPVPATLARVVPGNINPKNLGTTADVFVTDAKALQGLNAKQIADKLTIPQSSSGFKVIEFPTPSSGIASPVFRNNPGFVGAGRTAGGAPEFVIPNGPVPAGATTRVVQ